MKYRHRERQLCLGALLFFLHAAVLQAQDAGPAPHKASAVSASNAYDFREVEIGVGYSSEDSFRFGKYTGLQAQGIQVIANIRIDHVSARDDEDTQYWYLDARDLGLDSRSIMAVYGKQGLYKLSFGYDQLPHFKYDSVQTPFIGAGSDVQTLPGNWVASDTVSGMTNLFSSLNTFSASTERQKYSGGFSWRVNNSWQLNGEYKYESKQGGDLIGAIFGTNSGNARGALLLQPIDYETNDFTLSLSHTGTDYHFNLAWYYSRFENDSSSLSWQNPFLRPSIGNTWAPGTDFAAGAIGQMAPDPDNQAQQFSFSGAWHPGVTTQLRGNINYGRMEQDDAFLPYTTNASLLTNPALPRNELDGQIDTLYMDIGLTARPLRKLNISAGYNYDDRDNKTSRDLYQLVVDDSGNQGALLSSGARINTPYSFEKHRFTFDAAWRLPANSKLSAGYQYEQINRDYTEVEETEEHSGSIKLASTINAMLSGWIEYTHSQRDGSTYISNQAFLDNHNPAYVATLAETDRYINDPLLRKYTYADRDQDKVAASISVIPWDTVSLSLSGNYAKNDYPESRTGLQETDENRISVDVAYTPAKLLTAYAYLTREEMEYQQAGYQRAGITLFPGTVRTPPPCATCGFWNVSTEDEVHTFGAGLEWEVIENKLKLKFDYTWVDTTTDIIPDADSTVLFAALPELNTQLHSLGITGNYPVNDKLTLRFRYLYERFREADFALNSIGIDTLNAVITNGITSPDYAGHAAGLSLLYRF